MNNWLDKNWKELGKVYIEYFTTESKAFYTAYIENLQKETNSNIDLGTWYGGGEYIITHPLIRPQPSEKMFVVC